MLGILPILQKTVSEGRYDRDFMKSPSHVLFQAPPMPDQNRPLMNEGLELPYQPTTQPLNTTARSLFSYIQYQFETLTQKDCFRHNFQKFREVDT
jgi:hypothetical protein